MKIGIDIDEVVVEFVAEYLEFFKQKYDRKISFYSISSYDLWKSLGISRKKSIDLVYEFYGSGRLKKLNFVNGAKEGLEKIAKKNNIFFITSRHISVREETIRFFNSHFPRNGYSFIFSEDFFGGKNTKAEICNKLGIELFIEDNSSYALDCAKKGIRVFLLDKPWNKNYKQHKNLVKVKNWGEIMERLT